MKHLIPLCTALFAAALFADPADPQVSNVVLAQNALSRRVTVSYHLDETAIVTMDVLTNGVSIGGENIDNVKGDCFKRVDAGDHTLTWAPDMSWPDHRFDTPVVSVRIVAWATNCPPDYLVVDLTATGGPGTERWYPSAEMLPGGLLSNKIYRTTHLVMRQIKAKGVTWTMGSVSEAGRKANYEESHEVTLDANYFIGVFPVTQTQWALVQSVRPYPSHFYLEGARSMRPVENISYNEIRNSHTNSADTSYNWPADPNPNSFLGKLRAKTGIDFDLPGEAQWEFACRAGNGEGYWGDGSRYQNQTTDSNLPGRYAGNGGQVNGAAAPQNSDVDHGSAIVGSYRPNSWGIYDMHGNVWEWCLDWFDGNGITTLNGVINIDPANPGKNLHGANGDSRIYRGGSYNNPSTSCRAAYRSYDAPSKRTERYGCRVVCKAGLQ